MELQAAPRDRAKQDRGLKPADLVDVNNDVNNDVVSGTPDPGKMRKGGNNRAVTLDKEVLGHVSLRKTTITVVFRRGHPSGTDPICASGALPRRPSRLPDGRRAIRVGRHPTIERNVSEQKQECQDFFG